MSPHLMSTFAIAPRELGEFGMGFEPLEIKGIREIDPPFARDFMFLGLRGAGNVAVLLRRCPASVFSSHLGTPKAGARVLMSELSQPPAAAGAEPPMRITPTAEEERIFATLLAAVRHTGAPRCRRPPTPADAAVQGWTARCAWLAAGCGTSCWAWSATTSTSRSTPAWAGSSQSASTRTSRAWAKPPPALEARAGLAFA